MIVLHDIDFNLFTVLDTEETNTPGFTLAGVEDVSAGEIFNGDELEVKSIEEFFGIDYNDPNDPTRGNIEFIEIIENWEG